MRLVLLAASTISASLLVLGCGTSFTSTRSADTALIGRPESPAEVRAAIVRAMEFKRFVPESEEPGRIIARFDHSGAQLQVAVEYDAAHYTVRYLSSAGLETRPSPSGEVLVDSHWASWVRGLRARIGEEIKAPAKEAAESARRERDYQLMIEQQRTAQAQAEAQAAQANAAQGDPDQAPPPPAPAGNVIIQAVIPVLPLPSVNFKGSSKTVNQNFNCCINGASYTCPNAEALNQCATLSPNACTRNPGHCK